MSNGSSLEHEVVSKSLFLTEGLVFVPTDARLFVYLKLSTKVRKSSIRGPLWVDCRSSRVTFAGRVAPGRDQVSQFKAEKDV